MRPQIEHIAGTLLMALVVAAGCGSSGGGSSTGRGGAGGGSGGSGPGTGGMGGIGIGTGDAATGGSGPRDASGAGGTIRPDGGGADVATTSGDLGKACASNAECGGGLTCATADGTAFGVGGPAGGICTRPCGDDDAGDVCAPLGGLCVDMSTTATPLPFCMQRCTFGSPDRANKCRGRDEMGCASLTDGTATVDLCVPVCSIDADCPSGRHCDPGSGYCVTTVRAGDPLGAHCNGTADGGTNTCAGFCLPLGNGGTAVLARFCSQPCVLGAATACNIAAGNMSLAGAPHGGCLLAQGNADFGDVGFCSQECDSTTDCLDKTDTGIMCDTTVSAGSPIAPHGFCGL